MRRLSTAARHADNAAGASARGGRCAAMQNGRIGESGDRTRRVATVVT